VQYKSAPEHTTDQSDQLRRIGISSRISQLTYDPVQSLLAVGTTATTSLPGQIYVFGQKRISATFPLARSGSSVRLLQFCSDKLLCLDSKNDFHVYSLLTKTLIVGISPPGMVTALVSDPTLDYVFLGMQNGESRPRSMIRFYLTDVMAEKELQPQVFIADTCGMQVSYWRMTSIENAWHRLGCLAFGLKSTQEPAQYLLSASNSIQGTSALFSLDTRRGQ